MDVNLPIFDNSGNLDVNSDTDFGTEFVDQFVDCGTVDLNGDFNIEVEIGAVGDKDFVVFVQNGSTGAGLEGIPVALVIADFFTGNTSTVGALTDEFGDADFDDVAFGSITIEINNSDAVASAGGSVNGSFAGQQQFHFVDQFSPSETFTGVALFP